MAGLCLCGKERALTTRDTMELKEDMIRAQYDAALGLLTGFDHAPRLAKPQVAEAKVERSPGIGTADVPIHHADGDATHRTARRRAVDRAG